MLKMSLLINGLLRKIPKMDELLSHPVFAAHEPSPALTLAARRVLDKLRREIQSGAAGEIPALEDLAREGLRQFEAGQEPCLKRVINGTGIILHTNLGRAPLAAEALSAIEEAARGYSNLEYDISAGKRSSRYVHVEALLTQLTGAEAAIVVNNNAAAVLLALSAVARSPHLDEVIISRGELVEVGGSFRIPDVMEQSGCRLVEVGTTNKTHIPDYVKAIDPAKTGAILRVHTSNFAIIGFASKPSVEELAETARAHGIPLIEDLGSGCVLNLAPYGIHGQPVVASSIKAGADIVTFSGDKLLGGPQAGIIVGKADLVAKMKSHPLTRAFRIDKLCLAALEATLKLYLNPKAVVQRIPTLQMLCATADEILEKAGGLAALCNATVASSASVIKSQSQAGGGAMPEENLISYAVAITLPGVPPDALERHFRTGKSPIIGRVADDKFLLDIRTMNKEDFPIIVNRLNQLNPSIEQSTMPRERVGI